MTHPRTRLLAHTLPYPIARAICAIDAESEHAPERRLLHLLYALESVMQLLGSAVLVEAIERREEPAVRKALEGLKRQEHLSLGLWCWVLVRLAPKLSNSWMPELGPIAQSEAFRERLERLTQKRNELAHPARPMESEEARTRLAALRPDFDALIESVAFLGAWHLLGVHEPPRAVSNGRRLAGLPLRGRSIPTHDVMLTFEGAVEARDVLLVNPEVTAGLVLRPFFCLTEAGADDVLTVTRADREALTYYASGRPDALVREPLPRDDGDRPRSLWEWLEARRRPLRVRFSSNTDRGVLDEKRLLRRSQHGSNALPLRGLRHLRSGGMSEVFVGVDRITGVERVLKVPRSPDDRNVRRHFEEEFHALQSLRHEGIIAVHWCGDIEGLGPCIVEDLFDHPNLHEHLERGPFDAAEVHAITQRLLDAVAALHDKRMVHRDLKPANVLYDRATQTLKLIDLGIARRLDATSHPTTRAGHGTPEVMAPEQRFGGAITPATDVYSLAILVRTLYCGLASLARPHDDFDDPSIPAMVRAVLAVAASERPEGRFADARAMAVALERGLPERPSQPTPARAALLREGVIAEVDKIFARARTRVYAMQKKVGFTTPQDEFARELKEIFDETHVALTIVLSRVSLKTQDDVSRLTGSRPGLLDPAVGSTAQAISSGVVNAVGGILGAAGLVMGPLAAGAYSVATRKKRMLDACDAALAAFEDTHEAAVQAIIKG